ncbi:hypothetical protein [Dokdonella sp.]|uniref:hypothetical protein n=1 Tax=Dokdonella sp. TaxID=2291710 RepID=UPI001B10D5F7|nr:hypothetical protein [Dokdonella sp.]MBO9661432.1 hypothetical protein [Dokdonella sp.]
MIDEFGHRVTLRPRARRHAPNPLRRRRDPGSVVPVAAVQREWSAERDYDPLRTTIAG